MRRSPLVAVALLLGVLAPAAARGDEPPPVPVDYVALAPTLSQPAYPHLARSAVEVPMADGTHLYVEVVRPHPGVHGNGPWPVILEASPYHGTLADRDGTRVFPDPVGGDGKPLGLTRYFAPRGYAVVMVDLRGTGRSSGCLDHLGPKDASDLKAIVEWAAGRPWSNGRVGMTGHSYVGSTPSLAAAQRPKGLVTIVPSAGLASMYDHQFHSGVPWLLQWMGPMYAYELLALERHAPGGDDFGGDVESTGCGVPQSAAFAGTGQVTGQYQPWHAARDWRDAATDVDIPVFIVHGVNDNAARIPAAEWFFGRRAGRPGDKVWIGQWDHGAAGATKCAKPHPTCRFGQFQYALHAWFDRHLALRDVDTGPAVEVFLGDGVATARRAWDPAPAVRTLFPDATDGSLGHAPPGEDGTATFGSVADAVVASLPSATAVFRSAEMTEDTVLLGLPELRLDVSLSYGQVVDIVTTLWREDAKGVRFPAGHCAVQPQLRDGVDTFAPVTPGEVMPLRLQCFTVAHRVARGERLVLEVGTTSPHHASRGSDAVMTVHTGPATSSRYDLPVALDAHVVRDPLAG